MILLRIHHLFWGCIPFSIVRDEDDGSRTCELSCPICHHVVSRIVFPPIPGGYPPIERNERYWQTWGYVARLKYKVFQRPIQFVCWLVIGHEWSKTECGYAGGNKFDAWCRWCNWMTQLPADAHPAKMHDKMEFKRMLGERPERHD